jgi:hypothetical protein
LQAPQAQTALDRQGGLMVQQHACQAGAPVIQAVLTSLAGFLSSLKANAEQLTDAQRLRAILTRAFAKFMLATAGPPVLLTAQFDAN